MGTWDCSWDLQKTGNKVFSFRDLVAIIPEKQETERGVAVNGEKSVWHQAILVPSFMTRNDFFSTSAAT